MSRLERSLQHTTAHWHALAPGQVVNELRSDPGQWLTDVEAAKQLAGYGPNRLAEQPLRAAWRKFLDQFRNFLVIVLIGAAVLAGMVADLKNAIVIAIVVLLNATLGFVQEHRAEAALAALIASTVLLFDEIRKLAEWILRTGKRPRGTHPRGLYSSSLPG